jgi:hypothetical protein
MTVALMLYYSLEAVETSNSSTIRVHHVSSSIPGLFSDRIMHTRATH